MRKPAANMRPAPNSVVEATIAWMRPGFIPSESNQRPVPAMRPPRKKWLYPCAAIMSPKLTRAMSIARLMASTSFMALALPFGGGA